MISASTCMDIFQQSVVDYHVHNNVDHAIQNPFPAHKLEHLCYLKNWIDTVQWHLEDIIRDPQIDPVAGIELKRKIDRSNQHRTDVVEQIDDIIRRRRAAQGCVGCELLEHRKEALSGPCCFLRIFFRSAMEMKICCLDSSGG